MSQTPPTPEQMEEALRDNPKYFQLINEQHRYKQQCRLRALEMAFNKPKKYIYDVGEKQPETESNYLTDADIYYNWLIEIVP